MEGVAIEIAEQGGGPPLLLLHGGHPSVRIGANDTIVELLSGDARVIAPTHPGFAAPAPAHLTTVDDLAYLYLDLMDALDLHECTVVGLSLGGWIAAEMAVKSTARMSRWCWSTLSASSRARAIAANRRHLRGDQPATGRARLCRSESDSARYQDPSGERAGVDCAIT
jgi:esterase/lipase